MNKKYFAKIFGVAAVLTIAAGCLCLAGCGSSDESAVPDGMRAVSDAYGRQVLVPEQVEKVATVGSGARFVVYAGAQDKLVAVTEMEEPSPARPYTVAYADLFAELPTTSNGNHLMETEVDAEALLGLAPDVVISSRSAEECDALQESTGLPVIGISYQDELFSSNVYTSLQVVGDVCGTSDHVEEVVSAMQEWCADLVERTKDIADADKPSVYVGAVNFKGAKSFTGTYGHYYPFDLVHANNVADASEITGSFDTDIEQIVAWNPDIMFVNGVSMDLMRKDYQAAPEAFDSIAAFKNGRVYSQPPFNMNGTNIELGICNAFFNGATIYPDAFSDVDLPTKYDEIFTTLLGKPMYEMLREAGMDFKAIPVKAFKQSADSPLDE